MISDILFGIYGFKISQLKLWKKPTKDPEIEGHEREGEGGGGGGGVAGEEAILSQKKVTKDSRPKR